MAREVTSNKSFNGLRESDLNREAKSLFDEIRKTYHENKIKDRAAKTARKRRFRITSAFLLSVFIGLIMILHFSGLPILNNLSYLKFFANGIRWENQ